MMYRELANHYDSLVKDDDATQEWLHFVQKHCKGRTILEAACGSGEITLAMAKAGYEVTAADISQEMVEQAKVKQNSTMVQWSIADMRDLHSYGMYDAVCCFCDSLNYLCQAEDLQTFFSQAFQHLHEDGVLLFDVHSMDRLQEFEEEYCESGIIDQVPYEWTIVSEDHIIYQNFVFYDEQANPYLEQHVQRVYEPKLLESLLTDIGFQLEVFTDFHLSGIQPGEKYFYVCRKGQKS